MKLKTLAMGLILTGALTLVGCGASTEEALENDNETKQEQKVERKPVNEGEIDNEEYTEGDDMITNVMTNIEKTFNDNGLKVKEVTPFDGFRLDMGGNTTVDGGKLEGVNDTRNLALSEDLWYFNVKFENGWNTIVKYVIPADVYQGCDAKTTNPTGFMDEAYANMELENNNMAIPFNKEYVEMLKEKINEANANKQAEDEYMENWEKENLDENGNYIAPTYEDKQMESQMPENVQMEEQEEGITLY